MTPAILLLCVALAGGLGAALRYLVDGAVSARLQRDFPWGIMAVNLSGSLALGLLLGPALDGSVIAIVGVGLLGGYTTFSTASLDTVKLLRVRRFDAAAANSVGMLVAGAALAAGGLLLGAALL